MKERENILSNRNDTEESSFSFQLFENGIFSFGKLLALIDNARSLKRFGFLDEDLIQTINWIISFTNMCFIYQHDQDDLYFIRNYIPSLDAKWKIWSKHLRSIINS